MQKALLIGVLGLFTLPLLAETQTGYVRTIGRNGKPGQPISGVMVRAEGPANMVMSDTNGQFALLLNDLGRDDAFKLTTVKKSNYELLDKDLIGRECGFTPVPMEIVLVNLSEMQAEKAAMAERFEQKYAETYQKKVAELQAQLEAQQVTIEEAQKRQEELDQALEKMLGQIETLVDRYVRTDYDRLDSLDQVINAHIEQGEFDEAERLIRSKGSVEERLAALKESKEVQRQLEEAQRKLAAANDKKLESLKRDLNLLIDIAEAHLRPDSAYLYLRQLVEVDPDDLKSWDRLLETVTELQFVEEARVDFQRALDYMQTRPNPDTLLIAGWYDLMTFLEDNNELYYYKKRLELLQSYYKEEDYDIGICLRSIAHIEYDTNGESKEFQNYFEQAKSTFEKCLEKDSIDYASMYGLHSMYFFFHHFDFTKEDSCFYWNKAFEDVEKGMTYILKNEVSDSIPLTMPILIDMLCMYSNFQAFCDSNYIVPLLKLEEYATIILERYAHTYLDTLQCIEKMVRVAKYLPEENSAFYYNRAFSILEKNPPSSKNLDVYDYLIYIYNDIENYEKTKMYQEERLQYCKQIYGTNNLHTLEAYDDLTFTYSRLNDSIKLVDAYENIINISKHLPLTDTRKEDIADIYESLGNLHTDTLKALQAYENARDMYQGISTRLSAINCALLCNTIGEFYYMLNDIDKALENYNQALLIIQNMRSVLKSDWNNTIKPWIGGMHFRVGNFYEQKKDYKSAIDNYKKALKIFKEVHDAEHAEKTEEALARLKKK